MAKHIIDKLVRDRIVHHMESEGKTVHYRNLDKDHEKKEKLVEKLGEKYKELFESLIKDPSSNDHVTEHIADMLEVMNKIATVWGVDLKIVMEKKKQKLEEKGGYDNFVYIKHIED